MSTSDGDQAARPAATKLAAADGRPPADGGKGGERSEAASEPRGEGPAAEDSPPVPPSRVGPASAVEFAGWGTVEQLDDLGRAPIAITNLGSGTPHKLGVWSSTAICGNDITSSCLYVAALCAISAGPYAPICLAAVAALLYLFRGIYGEVGSALPLNGGAYNALLNTTSKFKASIAACLTILSYLATAVISANEAMHYAHVLWHGLDVFWATMVLLGLFALLNVIGITESAVVALGIFSVHIATLTVLCVSCFAHGFDLSQLVENWHTPPPSGAFRAIAFGFAAGLLGISGFESSANFIEEQKQGVFPKTLRNMWIAVAVFNPLISLLAMGMMPLEESWVVVDGVQKARPDFLAYMGSVSAGKWLSTLVSIDAVLVLSGAVLTSYVGVTGLVRRMSLDRCLPQFLLRENRWRGTNHYIIVGFFLLCCSIVVISRGDIEILAGVYTISFLSVMGLFAVGNMMLKVKRQRLPRAVRASWPGVLLAFVAVLAGLVGNVLIDYPHLVRLRVFAVYFGVSVLVVIVTFQRAAILRLLLATLQGVVERTVRTSQRARAWLLGTLDAVNRQTVIFFTKGDNIANLNRAAIYVLQNEQTKRLRVVHVYAHEDDVQAEHLARQLHTLDEVYPELRIDLVLVKGQFGPELIERLSRQLGVAKNYMFIGTPGDSFPHNIAELGGVRLII